MAAKHIVILSDDELFYQMVGDSLRQFEEPDYELIMAKSLGELPDHIDVVLIDDQIIDKDPTSHLASISYHVAPAPLIYISERLESQGAFTAVRSLASEYLFKNQLTPAGLHNSIKYAVQSTQLKLEIEKQQKRYQSLFYYGVDPAFFLNAQWEIENINDAFIASFGIKRSDIIGLHFKDLLRSGEDFAKLQSGTETGDKNFVDCELKFKRIDRKGVFLGHLKIIALKEYTLENNISHRETTGFHGTLSNISYRERYRKIKESSDRIGMTYRLARTMAHEIRNPLTNITLALNQLEDEMQGNDDAALYVGIIDRCAKRIDTLISQLLRSSELQNLSPTKCDLVDIINDAIDTCKDRAKLMGIEIKKDLELSEKLYNCDNEKLVIALSNLITNAIEAIEVENGMIIVGLYDEDDYSVIYVEDNGAGMDEKQRKSLFDPFYTSKPKGVGLGLTATQTIVSEHGGQIEVDTAINHGTTFTISLPPNEQ